MKKKILIITNCGDLHADIVASKLTAKNAKPFRINLDEFPGDFGINLEFKSGQQGGVLTHFPSQDELAVSDIGAVWIRKSADYKYLSEDLSPQEQAYAKEEAEHTLFSLLYSLNCFWMSHPLAIRGANWKGEQLQRAAKWGFKVPASIITNHPESVKNFRKNRDGEMIVKPMSSPFLAANKVEGNDHPLGLPTTLVTEELMNNLDAVRELPCYFQEYIPKKFELRVTVIGDQLFAAKIHSQDDPRTKIDFRDFSVEIPYEATQLPLKIKHRCLDFVHSYQLNFGALDIIVTPDDDYVFLENNPVGQFLFVEELVPEFKMMDALATCLVEGAECQA